jgi:hypothetical protein
MQKELINRYYNKLFLGIIYLLCIYITVRACCIDITDDEAWSFYNVKHFWYVETLCTGNTHWFNSLAIKMSLLFGLEQTWQIRWFSVLSGIGFMYVVYQWIKTLQNPDIKILAVALVLLHPYLLEYLSLARGYASGLCFMALSMLFLLKATKSGKSPDGFYALLLAGLSAVANFNFFYYFLAFCLLHFYKTYFKSGFSFLKNKWFYSEALYVSGITLLVLRALLFIRQCSNDIADFGGEELVPAVFRSYVHLLCYGKTLMNDTALTTFSYLLFGLVTIASGVGIFKFKQHKSRLFLYASVLLPGMLGLMVFNRYSFGVLYPTDRTALMFYPFIGIIAVEFIRCFLSRYVLVTVFSVLLSTAFSINVLFSINFKKGIDHAYCAGSATYFKYLDGIHAVKVGIPLDLYCVYAKYYKVTGTQFQAESVNTFGYEVRWIGKNKLEDFDHLLLFPPYNLEYYKPSAVKFKGVKYFHETGALIVRVIGTED